MDSKLGRETKIKSRRKNVVLNISFQIDAKERNFVLFLPQNAH